MKNILKKSLLIIILLLFSIQGVCALEEGEIFDLTQWAQGEAATVTFVNDNYDGYKYTPFEYQASSKTHPGDDYAAFCLDPGFKSGAGLKTQRLLMSNERYNAKDWGLLAILKQYNGSNFIAVEHAVRMYVAAVGWQRSEYFTDSSKVEHYYKYKAYAGNAYKAINEGGLSTNLRNGTGRTLDNIVSDFKLDKSNITYFTGGHIDEATTFFKIGISAAANYQSGMVGVANIKLKLEKVVDTEEDNKKIAIVAMSMSYINDFNLNNLVITRGDNVVDVELAGWLDSYSEDPEAYSQIASIGNAGPEKTYYIAYLVEHNLPEEGEETIHGSFTLSFSIRDSNFVSGGILYPTSDSDIQRFIVFQKGVLKGELEVPLDGNVTPPPPDEEEPPEQPEPCKPDFNLPPVCKDDSGQINDDKTVTYSFKEGVKDGEVSILACIVENTDVAANDYKLIDDRAEVVNDNPYCAVYCKEDYEFTVPYKQYVDNGRYFRIRMGMKGQQDCYLSKMNEKQYNKDIIKAQEAVIDAYNEWQRYYEIAHAGDNNHAKLVDGNNDTGTYSNYKRYAEEDEDGNVTWTTEWVDDDVNTAPQKNVKFEGTYYNYREVNGQLVIDNNGSPAAQSFSNEFKTYSQFVNISINGYGCINCANTDGELVNIINKTVVIGKDRYGNDITVAMNEDLDYDGWPDTNIDYNGDDSVDILSINENYIYYAQYGSFLVKSAIKVYDESQSYYSSQEANAKRTLEAAIRDLDKIVDQYNSCMDDEAYTPYSEAYENHTWQMIYDYKPEIRYSYDEPDPTDMDTPKWITEARALGADVMEAKSESIKAKDCGDNEKCESVSSVELIFGGQSPVVEYCKESDLDKDTYGCANGLQAPEYDEKYYFTCQETGGRYYCSNTAEYSKRKVTNISYLHKVAVAEGDYDTPRVYYSNHPDGSVVIANDYPAENNYTLVEGLPVGINTPYGTYFYILSFNNIGKYYSTGELGRIYSENTNSLAMVVNEPASTSDGKEVKENQYACTYDVPTEVTPPPDEPSGEKWCIKTAEKYYVCTKKEYTSDPRICTEYEDSTTALNAIGCVEGEKCEHDLGCGQKTCPKCELICVGTCIQDVEKTVTGETHYKLLFNFVPVTPAKVNINDREMGYNWDIHNSKNALVAKKAANTISEIESRANITNVSNPVEIKKVEDYDFKITLTPAVAKWVRDYNAANENKGSYNSNSMECYDYDIDAGMGFNSEESCSNAGYTWKDNKCVMPNIFCYSKFIDELISAQPDAVDRDTLSRRSNAKTAAFTNYTSFTTLPYTEAPILTNDYWTIYIYSHLDINGDSIPDIGPSWK